MTTLNLTYTELKTIQDLLKSRRSIVASEVFTVDNKFKEGEMSSEKKEYWLQVQDNLYKQLDLIRDIRVTIDEALGD